ncbi:hypothetical protein CYMTET_55113 [Cymbomonas tetramitiformis]|uniref:Thioredoxin domain-containing protein n=1 Tax=Cymbomonas tetramitiformis TaxID=36881 RepID=A0AAE0ENU6_9CHLO|nr:hypothetical protein CYMTET_55113 [Cymbomonas tetramitiformis]|eukprot:gene29419-36637_t
MSIGNEHVADLKTYLKEQMQTKSPCLVALKSSGCSACVRLEKNGFFETLSRNCASNDIGLVMLSTDSYKVEDVHSFARNHGVEYLPSFIRLESADDKKGRIYDLRNNEGFDVQTLITFFKRCDKAN